MTSIRTSIRKVRNAEPFIDQKDIDKILEDTKQILQSKKLVLGNFTKKFEDQFRDYVGTKYSVAVNTASSALEIVLKYLDVKNSEVIVPTNTFIACPNAILYAGGKPVFADMNPESFCMQVEDIKRKISPKTKAIMAVHLGGLAEPAMDELREICSKKSIHLIEDCSHAHGAMFREKKVGSLCEAGCFSFFATKILPTGTGGMITTDDPKLQEFAEAYRHQGGLGGEGQIEVFDKFGNDCMISEITAAIGINQLSKLDEQIKIRRKIAGMYENRLNEVNKVKLPPKFENSTNVYWRFITSLDDKIDRDNVRLTLRKEFTIDGGILYPTLCHLQPVYTKMGHKEGECPSAERAMKHQLTLPVTPYLTEEDVDYVVDSLSNILNRKS
jgi:perosamine synthetase